MNGRLRIPLFPLRLVLLPGMALPLHIFEERYRKMIADLLDSDGSFGVVYADGKSMRPEGCLARVDRVLNRNDDGTLDVLTVGMRRFTTLRRYGDTMPYDEAEVEPFDDTNADPPDALLEETEATLDALDRYALLAGKTIEREPLQALSPESFSFALAGAGFLSLEERQESLETKSTLERMKTLRAAIERWVEQVAALRRLGEVLRTDRDLSARLN